MRMAWGVLFLAACACGTERSPYPPPPPPPGTSNQVITILNYTFSPQRLTVTPGSTVLVWNEDLVEHTVTSSAAAGTFVAGSVNGVGFDTGPFLGTTGFSIPGDAPVGTVVPYFCRMFGPLMIDQGEIEVIAP